MTYRVASLLSAHRASSEISSIQRMHVQGLDGADAYNPARPLRVGGKCLLPVRVEPRSSEDSHVRFLARQTDGSWKVADDLPAFRLQDPFWCRIGEKLVFGGVHVDFSPSGTVLGWRTDFLIGRTITTLKLWFSGPKGMKDIRLCPLPEGRVAVFSRPQGAVGGRGQIGFTVAPSLDAVPETISQAPLLGLFDPDEWGGVNQAVLLKDGTIGVLGHIACFSPDGARHYYPMAFTLAPRSASLVVEPRILIERRELLPGPAKRPDLADVLFPGGMENAGSRIRLYLGVSDVDIQTALVPDPFA